MCVFIAYTVRCQHDTHYKLLHPCVCVCVRTGGGFDATLSNDGIFAAVDGASLLHLHPVPSRRLYFKWICLFCNFTAMLTHQSHRGSSMYKIQCVVLKQRKIYAMQLLVRID